MRKPERSRKGKLPRSRKAGTSGPRLTEAMLKAMVEEATVDCHDESEQFMGLFTMIQDNLAVPFEARVLGVEVSVVEVETNAENSILGRCVHGNKRCQIPLLVLPLPLPRPAGWEWVEAYRYWRGGS